MDFPPAHIAFGTWAELGSDVHVSFYSLRKVEPSTRVRAFEQSLRFAVDLHRHPSKG